MRPLRLLVHLAPPFLLTLSLAAARTNVGPFNLYEVDRPGAHVVSAIALNGTGRLAVAYGDDRLYFAEWDGARWNRTVVDDQVCLYPGSLPSSSVVVDLAFDPAGEPGITYYDATATQLKFARRVGSVWMTEVVDTNVGHSDALAFDAAGNVHIGYADLASQVRYALWNGSSWSLETVDSGLFGSLAVEAGGIPHVTYYDLAQRDLRHARKVSGSWLRETVDATGDAGAVSAIALTSVGLPRIVHEGQGGLRYASWDGSAWTSQTIPRAGHSFSGCPTLILDPAGLPHISAYKQAITLEASLWYIHFDGSSWLPEEVAIGGTQGIDSSIALDAAGRPNITHFDVTNSRLRWTRWTGTQWLSSDVDRKHHVGFDSAVALDSAENPAVSYFDVSDRDLRYAAWDGTDWKLEMVDTSNFTGYGPSLAFDASDRPRMSYVDSTFSELRYARRSGATWSRETVDSTNTVAGQTSLALDGAGNPHISYSSVVGVIDHDLDYARWTGSAWLTEQIDSTGDVGEHNSLALDAAGLPRIAYGDDTNDVLKYARWDGAAWSIETVAAAGQILGPTPLALDSAGNPHIAVYESALYELRYLHWDGTAWVVEVVASGSSPVDPSLVLDAAGFPHIAYRDSRLYTLRYAHRDAAGWHMATLDTTDRPPSIAVGASGEVTITYISDHGICLGGPMLRATTSRHLGPLTSYRGRVETFVGFASGPGWKETAFPLTSANDDETGGFPTPGAGPGRFLDLAVPDAPLVLYRDLAPGEQHSGNALKLVKAPGGIALSH